MARSCRSRVYTAAVPGRRWIARCSATTNQTRWTECERRSSEGARRAPRRTRGTPVLGFAGSGIPLRGIRLAAEVRAGHELLREVFRIVHDSRDDEPFRAIWRSEPIEEFGQRRVFAVGHTIAAQP